MPNVSDVLMMFFENEIEDYRENVRNGNIDAATGFHPTLSSALDTLQQAPEDVKGRWLGVEDDKEVNEVWKAVNEVENLAWLIVELGPEALLTDICESRRP